MIEKIIKENNNKEDKVLELTKINKKIFYEDELNLDRVIDYLLETKINQEFL